MSDPWAEFAAAPAADPWAEFAAPPKAAPSELDQRNGAGKRFLRTAGETLLNMVRPGQYALPPAASPRQPGEDDRAYALRTAHEGLTEMGTPEGVSRGLSMAAYTIPRGTVDVTQKGSPLLRKSAAAQTLEAQGVKGLTTGQMVDQPQNSLIAAMEKVSDKSALGMGAQREAVKKSWQVSEIAKARKAGEPSLPQDVQGAFREAHARFEPEYDALGAHPVSPEAIAGIPERSMTLPGGLDQATRTAALNEIGNALTVIPGVKWHPPGMHGPGHLDASALGMAAPQPIAISRSISAAGAGERPIPGPSRQVWREDMLGKEPAASSRSVPAVPETPPSQVLESSPMPRTYPGTNRPAPAAPGTQPEWKPVFQERPEPPSLTTGDLINVRKHIRNAKREAVNEPDRLRALGHAEAVVTDALEQSLPGDGAAALRDADARYATLMRAERAAPQGHSEFTPQQFLRSAERSSGRSSFKQGEAFGQDSGEAARDVFSELAFTGGRPTVLSHIPGAGRLAVPVTRLLNTEWAKRALFETPRRPFRPQPPTDAAAVAWANALKKALQVEPIPAAADE